MEKLENIKLENIKIGDKISIGYSYNWKTPLPEFNDYHFEIISIGNKQYHEEETKIYIKVPNNFHSIFDQYNIGNRDQMKKDNIVWIWLKRVISVETFQQEIILI